MARKPPSRAEQDRRNYVWRHNSYSGSVRMALMNLRNMRQSMSLTFDAQIHAAAAVDALEKLTEALKTRVDPK